MNRPNQKDVFFAVGVALLTIQLAEKILKLYLPDLAPKVRPKSIKKLLSTKELMDRATLGKIIRALKENVKIEGSFGKTLEEFLTARNMFVHTADKIPGWGMETDKERAFSYDYSKSLCKDSQHVIDVMLGLAFARKDLALNLPASEYFERIKKEYAPLAKVAFPI